MPIYSEKEAKEKTFEIGDALTCKEAYEAYRSRELPKGSVIVDKNGDVLRWRPVYILSEHPELEGYFFIVNDMRIGCQEGFYKF